MVLIMVVIAFLGGIAGSVVYYKIHQSNARYALNTLSSSSTVSGLHLANVVQISTTTIALITTVTTAQAVERFWNDNAGETQ